MNRQLLNGNALEVGYNLPVQNKITTMADSPKAKILIKTGQFWSQITKNLQNRSIHSSFFEKEKISYNFKFQLRTNFISLN